MSVSPTREASRRAVTRYGWLHLCNGLDPRRDGGMVPSILGMTGALARGFREVTIATPTPSLRDAVAVPPGVSLEGPVEDLEERVRRAEVVHLHGLWQGHTRRGARAARRAGVPYLIAAHGMAEPWALRQKRLKKQVYTALIEGRNLRRAACLHALSRPEIGHLRRLAPQTPICWVPNGVDLACFENLPPRSAMEGRHPELKGKFLLLFLGRLHPKKGLDLLAEALTTLAPNQPALHLLLAGTEDGAGASFLSRMENSGLRNRVTVLGHLAGENARQAWGAADAFVLPSYSEGFSMAILEALASRLPVLATTACHFPELTTESAGIVAEPTARSVTESLADLLALSAADRAALGARGRALVERHYTWDRQAERLADVYRWLGGGGPPPEAVVLSGRGEPGNNWK